jgi:FkbM family methyltransferase
MTKYVNIENIIDTSKIEAFNFSDFHLSRELRGVDLSWLCLSKRTAWMACGHEYIEPECLDWIDSLENDSTLFDIGASNGIFSIYAGKKNIQVTAFEPDPFNFFLISYNNYLNSKDSYCLKNIFNIAITDKSDLQHLHSEVFEVGGHLKVLNKTQAVNGKLFNPEYSQTVTTYSLDNFIETYKLDYPNNIKIDVDGSEFNVLKGAQETLKQCNSIYIELLKDSIDEAIELYLPTSDFEICVKKQVQNYKGLYNLVFNRI